MRTLAKLSLMAAGIILTGGSSAQTAPERQLLWGDTHLHTSLSFDAYLMGNKEAGPDVAYRFARGLPVVHPYSNVKVQLDRPLDFLVVSDHGEYLGIIQKIFAGDPLLMKTEIGRRWKALQDAGKGREAYFEAVSHGTSRQASPELQREEIRSSLWSEIVDAAQRHNQPGTFTSFVGWEWSSITNGANLHRVIVTDADGESGKSFLPYSLFDSDKPEDLWTWLEQTSAKTGVDFVSIPHNSNVSKGLMFPLTDSFGNPVDADYAKTRMRWEPIIEVTQIKGDSETHPSISPDDEFAGFEKFEKVMEVGPNAGKQKASSDTAADYARGALLRGLEIDEKINANPFKFGLIGSTDAHTSLSTADERSFWGKMALDSTPENTLNQDLVVIPPKSSGLDMAASGRAAVWAQENTRESIMAAFKRKEVYATTGPRIQLRVFASFAFDAKDERATDLVTTGYAKGVPMGGDLAQNTANDGPLKLLIDTAMDPLGATLDRVQVIKGYVDDKGTAREKIYNVAWSGNRQLNAQGKLPVLENAVNEQTLAVDDSLGDARFTVLWQDPDFVPSQRAFYYVRVIEIPTPRHTLFDAVALNVTHPDTYPSIIQERAYSSPIWYLPSNKEQ